MTIRELVEALEKMTFEQSTHLDAPIYYAINPNSDSEADREKFVLQQVIILDGMVCIVSPEGDDIK